ncbi:MAG: molybdopterin-dependent oxidoreductase [Chloroflexota bacterium]
MARDHTVKSKGETTVYTTCLCNCGGTSQCVLKAHLKDGVVTRVEPDDRYNTGAGREDEVLSPADLIKTRLQRRPCPKGLAFHRYLYSADRILYPLKLAPGTRRGEGKYVRISWEEALDTIAGKMVGVRKKYGPYSIITAYPNDALARIFSFWGAGANSWGLSSCDAQSLMGHIVAGVPGRRYTQRASGSAADMLANTKLVVLWGYDPTMGHNGPAHQFAWFIKLCRERGRPVILIEPRYTTAAEVLADQWLPIKPGTDHAMFLGMIHVLLQEDLYDKDFVSRYVDPVGLKKLEGYVMGDDGTPKTPEWAEAICAVPARTIRELAHLVATTRPAWLWCNWSVTRKSRGEQTVQAFAALQALLGYWGSPGAGPSFSIGPRHDIPVRLPWGPTGNYPVPRLYRAHYWAQAVLKLNEVRSGQLSEEEYRKMMGWRADPSLVKEFNPRMLFWGGSRQPHANDHLVTITDTPNDQIKALERMEFIVTMHSRLTSTARYADIILPAQDWMWEEKNITRSSYGGFESVNYCPGAVKPPGEVRPLVWVYTKLADRLGIDPNNFFSYYTGDENWDRDWERYLRDCYQGVIAFYKERGVAVPSWEEFTRGKFINCDELDDKPYVGWQEQRQEGQPFKTDSGRIEFYCRYLADEANRGKGEHIDARGSPYNDLPGDWRDLDPMPVYRPAVRGMDDPLVEKYPLMLLSPHCRYRAHYLFWDHPWLKDHVYRHRVWLNAADAAARGIKDNDMIKVYNDRGTVVMPAYVTSRIMPGAVVIRHGGRYLPDSSGVDHGGAPSTLLGGDFTSCPTTAKVTTVVQVEKRGEGK